MQKPPRFTKVRRSGFSRMRREGKMENLDQQKEKYPVLAEKIVSMSDILIEVLDARFINETRNKGIEKKIQESGKKLLYVVNKSDLAISKEKVVKEMTFLFPRVFVSCKTRAGMGELRDKIKMLSKDVDVHVDKGRDRAVVGVIGYPNTGKSSIINLLIGRKSSGVGSEAGFTKGIIKLKLTSDVVILDSPGIIPKEEYSMSDSSIMSKHAKLSARSYSQVKDPAIAVAQLVKEFPGLLEEYYHIESNGDAEVLLETLGRKKGFLKKGNEIEEDKTARSILKEWQEGKIKL